VDLAEWIGLANFPATTSNVIARREWLLRFPFRPYHFIHDYYFLLQTVLRDQMMLCPEPLVNYRVHATNTINTNPGPLMREMVRMNLDLLHDLAPELPTNAALRSKLATYLRSSWENVSALHQGVLQTMLAQAAARLSEEEILTMTNLLTPEAWSELAQYPNKALVNSWDETGPLGSESGLAEKFASVKSELSARKAAQAAWKDLARLQGEMAQSKWLALGRLFGVRIDGAEKGEPQQRLEALKAGLGSSGWLGLGASLGSGHCRRLRDASKPQSS
jgi:hypothetical protein